VYRKRKCVKNEREKEKEKKALKRSQKQQRNEKEKQATNTPNSAHQPKKGMRAVSNKAAPTRQPT
jgi:hypothetical protein